MLTDENIKTRPLEDDALAMELSSSQAALTALRDVSSPLKPENRKKPVALTRFAWLSIVAAIMTISLKTTAYMITGSVGLLSDAAESVVNLIAAIFALLMLSFAAQPADEEHPFGHGKAEYFASGLEGVLILVAATGIAWAAVDRLLHPMALEALSIGLGLSVLSTLINLAVARILLVTGRKYGSIALEADGHHLMTDVWTTVAILVGLGGYALTGWLPLDPIIAILAALQICWSGISLMARSIAGLLDRGLPAEELAQIEAIFERYRAEGIDFHDLRTRQAGSHRLVTVHVLVPGDYTVKQGHDVTESIEVEIKALFHSIIIVTHLEPREDPASFEHDCIDTQRRERQTQIPKSSVKSSRKARSKAQTSAMRPWVTLTGGLMLIGGGAGSMMTQGIWGDVSLGGGLLGFILLLTAWKKGRG